MKKKVLFLSSGDTYGAYEFIYRMAKFMEDDYHIAMVVRDKNKVESWISHIQVRIPKNKFIKRVYNYLKRKIGIKIDLIATDRRYVFLPNEDELIELIKAENILKQISFIPDVIISGMTDGFINTSTLYNLHKQTGAQIYQIMVDMSFLTGGCHVVWDCIGFHNCCNECPAITNTKYNNFSKINIDLKNKNIQQGNFKLLVTPGWSLHQANLSSLYKGRIQQISCSVVDTDVFTNINRSIAKQVFYINGKTKVIFAGSNNAKDSRKGRHYLIDALEILWDTMKPEIRCTYCVLLAGNHNTEDELTARIPFNKKLIDFISDYRLLSLAYQASDVFVCPSLEDGGPMMVAEALACGTPVVGFKTGLLFDNTLVQNGLNGYRVKIKDTIELSFAIKKVLLLSNEQFHTFSVHARNQALKHTSRKAFLDSIDKII